MASTADHLRSAGLRATAQRGAVLEVLHAATEEREHLTAATVMERVRGRLGVVSPQAVYDCLGALTRAGLAGRVELPGHPARYEARAGDDHHHLVCRGCGLVRDVDRAVGDATCLRPAAGLSFPVERTEVTYWGLCPDCADGGSPPIDPEHEEGLQHV